MQRRDSDDRMIPVARTGDRIFLLGAQWYFQTREYDHGPFDTRHDAEAELERYVCDMQYLSAANMNPVYLFGAPRHKPIMESQLRLIDAH
ncbi:MAG: DUF6316 family protein [Pseudomonadota bacterium]